MHRFLQQTVSQLLDRHKDCLDRVAIVLPGRRPMIFLRELLTERIDGASWLPQLLTIQEAMERLSGFRKMDAMELWLECYKHYLNVTERPDDLDTFLGWAPTVLADFNEIDNYDLNGEQVFRNLASFTEIDQWSFHLDPLSDGQERFQVRWEETGQLYRALRAALIAQSAGYNGLVNRHAADSWESRWGSHDWPFDHVYFVGFNALSAAEERLMFGMQKAGKATLLWDADRRFVDHPVRESGMFLRRFAKVHGPLALREDWALSPDRVQLHSTTSRIAQPKVLAALLRDIPVDQLHKTAVVLGDESLLTPVLESIPALGSPDAPIPVNLTLGYPLRYTPVYDLIHSLHATGLRMRSGGIWHQDIRALLRHAALAHALAGAPDKVHEVLRELRANNQAFLPTAALREWWQGVPVLEAILHVLESPYTSAESQCAKLLAVLDALKDSLDQTPWLLEMVFRAHRSLQSLHTWCSQLEHTLGQGAFWNLWRRAAGGEQLDFRGEPLEGLQVMGMLETRALGFERLIILGANEGHMPKSSAQNSFIPSDLKRLFKLPTRHERDAIYAYYFFRLLQDAEQVDIIYANQTEAFGSAERSRYIGQLEAMLERDFPVQHWQNPLPSGYAMEPWSFPNEPAVIRAVHKLLEHGLSPSALNTYVRCPLDFYFKYLHRFSESDDVAESVDSSLFGTLVHGVLEHLYLNGETPDPDREEPLGTVLTPAFLDDCIAAVPQLFEQLRTTRLAVPHNPKRPLHLPELTTGINRLTLDSAQTYVTRFLQAEKRAAKEQVATILYLEKPLEATLDLPAGSAVQSVELKGTIDRVDRVGDVVRVIDYKTGNVEGRKLRPHESAEKLLHPDADKARQLLIYHLLTTDFKPLRGATVVCGMISLKQISQWTQFGAGTSEAPESFNTEQLDTFTQAVTEVVDALLDPDRTWTHTEQFRSFCAFCQP